MSVQILPSLSLFFPAYNEEDHIEELVESAHQAAQNITDDYEIIIVNDGSTDRTKEKTESLLKKYPNLVLVNHEKNQGYGGAVWSGFNTASKEWIFFSDADLQFDLDEITKLTQHTNEFDVVIGFRKNRQDPFMRSVNAWGWKVLNKTLFRLHESKDIDCAFKLIKASAIKPILPAIISRGAMVSAEFLIRLKKSNYGIKEVGVTHYPRTAGSPTGASPKVIAKAFIEMAAVYRTLVLQSS